MKLKRPVQLLIGFFLAVSIICFGACRRSTKVPEPTTAEYRTIVSAFYVGLAALQVGDDARADQKLKQVTELAPDEPAAWANWGLLAVRRREFDAAAVRLEKARALAPQDSRVYMLLGVMDSSRGKSVEAIASLRRAVELNPKDLKALYLLALETERAGGENSDAEVQKILENIRGVQPDNLAALLEITRIAAKRGDVETTRTTIAQISGRKISWPAEIREQFDALQSAANGSDVRTAATRVAFLRNVLMRDAEYRRSQDNIKTPPEIVAEPFVRLVTMAPPASSPAPPDEQITFSTEPIGTGAMKWEWCGAISLTSESAPVLVSANTSEVQISGGAKFAFPGGTSNEPLWPNAVLGLDYNYDFKTDLALAGAGGFRLFKQGDGGAFTDVTAQTKLPSSISNSAFVGVWVADIELDGDLDLVLGRTKGDPLVLRNNGDGTFKEIHPFEETKSLLDFAWADLDNDGDPDAAMLSMDGELHVYTNERGGQFKKRRMPDGQVQVRAFSVADINSDGISDLLLLQENNNLVRVSDKDGGREWQSVEIVQVPGPPDNELRSDARLRILVADLDNNGGLDIVMPGPFQTAEGKDANVSGRLKLWLSDDKGNFKPLQQDTLARIFTVADLNGDGRLDFAGLAMDGQPVRLINRGTMNYHWQVIRPRAQETAGDQRVNSFGIGGEIEIRAGLLTSRQTINSPQIHFGLGGQEQTDVARIVWPNGVSHAEFELKADQAILAEQRLKGSCPSLFAFDGKQMQFVKDCAPWSPAIGLRINSNQTAEVSQTEEWIKIRGDQLAPRDGFYDLRITAELWEIYYLDHYSLMAVDHASGTEVFVDERTARTPPKLKVYTVATPQPFTRATDEKGKDVTDIVRLRDGTYLDTFGRGEYQGITRDHYVELTLDEDAPRKGQLLLIAHGWLHPTDASINVAYSQGDREPPRDLSLEVQDASGNWKVSQPHLGFPAGKNKTIVVDLSDVFGRATPRRLRLRTNMEIYWDALEWAVGRPDAEVKTERQNPATAELRFRGFSEMNRANWSSPETPAYDKLADSTQRWRDLIGYYTRFGDVLDLLVSVDDRYVIANAGDELLLRFGAFAPSSDGLVRDYVLIGNGWIKDGDYNSMFSKTVLPLPWRARRSYKTLAPRLEDDPAYRLHREDWRDYHTRYVTPRSFLDGLRVNKKHE